MKREMENGKGYLYETKSNSRVAIVLFFLTDQIFYCKIVRDACRGANVRRNRRTDSDPIRSKPLAETVCSHHCLSPSSKGDTQSSGLPFSNSCPFRENISRIIEESSPLVFLY